MGREGKSGPDFVATKACEAVKAFIFRIDNCIKHGQTGPAPPGFVLEEIKEIVQSTRLSNVKGRFANPAMAEVIDKIEQISENPHLRSSFGNKIRMDFGTGHELNFLCFLYTLVKTDELPLESVPAVLTEYFRIVRLFIKKFNVEAAGSRGCWSVDDHLLLPYLFGSSEYFSSPIPCEDVESGMFWEACLENNSPVLRNIRKLPWAKINVGMIKLYEEEVLGKTVVTQHFIYSDLLPIN